MTRRRFTVVVVPAILLFISVSSCTRARMADSTGATGAGGTTPTEALLPPPASLESRAFPAPPDGHPLPRPGAALPASPPDLHAR